MEYYLSTISDVDFEVCNETEKITYKERTAKIAKQYQMGLELAEFCISENLEEKYCEVLPHFEYNRNSVDAVVLHAPYNELYPHAIDKAASELAYRRYQQIWEICKKYQIPKIIIHGNYVPSLYFPEWFKARNIEFWKRFLSEQKENITVCIENVMEPTPDLITDIIKVVDSSRLRMCLDVGHANLTDIKPEIWLRECAECISHYHIHNNYGPGGYGKASQADLHLGLGKGIIDMKAMLMLAEELTPSATASVESYETEESAAWLKGNGFI